MTAGSAVNSATIDSFVKAFTAVRAVIQLRDDSFDGVWTPRFTPSRTPLLDQRSTAGTQMRR
jgi:hypothetical protein